ncbi:uncharacterized protein PHALS_15229 [Plasmopara halstedii]|uniref:Uncharacterized protein n=1 Tax=Plasmopara halstedii TaxID=4781 RepID=A0A0P1B734_PLAHL|nr:uncharacterized protein PHALS_15229 [Plasmopara halstedii]CEG49721.1 hypothetical protein PHALS_15229 [Plasmopara halstedii]|eukprot:XP_024586090.1 hypothetical protein PHALS_15229 [Plasmopara halstedii]
MANPKHESLLVMIALKLSLPRTTLSSYERHLIKMLGVKLKFLSALLSPHKISIEKFSEPSKENEDRGEPYSVWKNLAYAPEQHVIGSGRDLESHYIHLYP